MMKPRAFPPLSTLDDVIAVEAKPYTDFMPWRGLHEAIAAVVSREPDAPAITLLADDTHEPQRSWTYRQLREQVEMAGNAFLALAEGDIPRVAMLLPAIPEGYATLWGAASVGTVVPINYVLRKEHIYELLRAARCNIVVALGMNQQLAIDDKLADIGQACPEVRQVLWVGNKPPNQKGSTYESAIESAPIGLARKRSGSDVAALFHTGGTTGSPKLVQHTHANQLHSAAGAASLYGMSERDRIVNAMPLFHVAGTIVFGLSTILAGGEIILPTVLGLRNASLVARYWEMVHRTRATLLTATPTGIATLLAAVRPESASKGVRALLTGGAPLPPELAVEFEAKTGIPVRNTFGMTECAGVVCIEPALAPRKRVSCGIRIPFTAIEVTGAHDQPVREGEVGVLRLRGPNVSPGYTETQRNAGTFEQGWLITGDLARVRDGSVEVTGRSKDVIIRNSHNIDPQQIEEALMKHPAVLMAAAVGQPDEYAGELPVAFVVLKPGATLEVVELLAFAGEHIAERPAHPKRIDFIESLPQTAVGKVYKPALRLMAIERSLRERLVASGLSELIDVRGRDEAHGLCVDFHAIEGRAITLETREGVRALMRSFSYEWRLDGSDTLPGTAS